MVNRVKTSLAPVVAALLSAALLVPAGPPAAAVPAPATTEVPLSVKAGVKAPRSAQAGSSFTVTGRVPVRGHGRRVVKAVKGNRQVAKTRTSKRGAFTLRLKAGSKTGAVKYRLLAPKAKGAKAWSRTVKVRIVAAPAPTSAITSTWPSASISVPLGASIPVSGVVTGTQPAGRTVVIQQFLGNAWLDRVSTTSGADGSYASALPGSWLFSAPARVVVKAAGSVPEAAAVQVDATVTPTWTPGGSAASWVPVHDGYRIRVNPCETVEYRANLAQAPTYAREALTDAIASVSAATGVTFVNLGDSTGIGKPEPGYTGIPADTDLLISWVYDAQTVASQPPTNGGVAIHDTIARGTDAYGAVTVAKKSAVNMNAAYHRGWNRTLMTHVYRHEIGHILGLGHPAAQDQVMGAGESLSTNFAWGAGDLAGFKTLGLQSGCVTG
jgi:hypothetical protein